MGARRARRPAPGRCAAPAPGVRSTARIAAAAPDLREQLRLDDEHPGAAVAQDPARLVGLEVPVDRAVVRAQAPAPSIASRKAGLVVQHEADHVAFADARALEARRRAGSTPLDSSGEMTC